MRHAPLGAWRLKPRGHSKQHHKSPKKDGGCFKVLEAKPPAGTAMGVHLATFPGAKQQALTTQDGILLSVTLGPE